MQRSSATLEVIDKLKLTLPLQAAHNILRTVPFLVRRTYTRDFERLLGEAMVRERVDCKIRLLTSNV